MGSLTGQTPASDYGGLLNVNAGSIVGLTNVLQQVTDGFGSPTPLQLSTIAINIIRSGYTFQLDGVAVTALSININSMAQANPVALGTGSLTLPVGGTADRPLTPTLGMERYNTDLNGFEGYTATGWQLFPSGSFVTSILGTANRITATGTSAVTIDIAATYVGQTSLTTLGVITTGTWHGSKIAEIYGGTNQSTYTLGDILYASAANTLSKLAGNITTGVQYLSQTGTGAVSAAPVWATITGGDITGAALSKTDDTNVTLTLGGTPLTALLRAASLTLGWTGTLSPTRGGFGLADPTAHGILVAEGSSAVNPIVLSSGQILIGSTGADPVAAAINSGSGILVGNAAGSITVSNTGVLSNIATANQTTVSGATGNVTIGIASNAVLPGAGGVTLPTGNTAARAGIAGTIRFNSQTSVFESTVDGSNWLTINTAGGTVTTVSGTLNRITSTGGTTPVIDIAATYVGQTSLTTLGTIATGVWQGTNVDLAHGGSNASLTASNGGLVYSTATAMAILAGTATANQIPLSGASAAPSWSTATYPATTTINQLLYSSAANTIVGLTTANSASLVTTSAGVPVMSSTMTNGQLIIGSTGATPVAGSLTAGTNITITPGAGTITIAASGGGSNLVGTQDYRLTLTSNTPVTTTDVTAATTLYFTPYKGNQISLYNGASWVTLSPGQLSITNSGLSATTTYDVVVDYNGGTPVLGFRGWSNSTPGSGARTTALVYQDGILVLSGSPTLRYVGTIYTNGSSQFTDSFANRLTYNYYNRVSRSFGLLYTASSWGQANNNTWEIFNNSGSSANIVVGVQEDNVYITVEILATGSGAFAIGVGVNSSTVNSATINNSSPGAGGGGYPGVTAHYTGIPTLGYQYYCPLEYGPTASMGYFTNQVSSSQSGLTGAVLM